MQGENPEHSGTYAHTFQKSGGYATLERAIPWVDPPLGNQRDTAHYFWTPALTAGWPDSLDFVALAIILSCDDQHPEFQRTVPAKELNHF